MDYLANVIMELLPLGSGCLLCAPEFPLPTPIIRNLRLR